MRVDRSRSPKEVPSGAKTPERIGDSDDCLYACSDTKSYEGFVNNLHVCEFELNLAPRDVHMGKGGIWMVNSKARKGVEVSLRNLKQEDKLEFEKAMKKEIDSFVSSEAVQICDSQGIPEERILKMRWIFVWKPLNDEHGKEIGKKAKARLIIRGYEDPRLTTLEREAPTLSCLGRNLLLSETARKKKPLFSGDIKTAFLQGDKSELDSEVYGLPPQDVRERLGTKPHEILRIAKAIYGLLNAPKRWYDALSKFLVNDGWMIHSLDKCLFKRIDENGCVCGYLGIHVDDVLTSGDGMVYKQAIDRLRQQFSFGSWENAMDGTITYCGCEIRQHDDYSISLDQQKFSLSIDEINVSTERKMNTQDVVTENERKGMRQCLGALNWRATQSAPWLLSTVSHLQGVVEHAQVQDLLAVNRLVRLQRKHFDQGLYFAVLKGSCTLLTYTDASWATRRDGSSQGGQITLLVEQNALCGSKTKFSVLSWSSKKLKRIARSSTSAETQMSANALDSHEFAKLGFFDLQCNYKLDLRKSDDYLSSFKSGLVGDARNIYDGIVKVETSGLHMAERRTAIELLAIKERLLQASVELRWVESECDLADGLTKPWKHEPVIRTLKKKEICLVYDPEFQSSRKKKALRKYASDAIFCAWLSAVYDLAV